MHKTQNMLHQYSGIWVVKIWNELNFRINYFSGIIHMLMIFGRFRITIGTPFINFSHSVSGALLTHANGALLKFWFYFIVYLMYGIASQSNHTVLGYYFSKQCRCFVGLTINLTWVRKLKGKNCFQFKTILWLVCEAVKQIIAWRHSQRQLLSKMLQTKYENSKCSLVY